MLAATGLLGIGYEVLVVRVLSQVAENTVYTFASDYPHVEGGSDPMGKFTAQLDRFGPAMFEKFFVTNGEVLFPPV